jgi:hypothetical protein
MKNADNSAVMAGGSSRDSKNLQLRRLMLMLLSLVNQSSLATAAAAAAAGSGMTGKPTIIHHWRQSNQEQPVLVQQKHECCNNAQ